MHVTSLLQYATLFWVLLGALSVAVAVVVHREQVNTQIFLEMSGRYDELLRSVPADFWLGGPSETALAIPRTTLSTRAKSSNDYRGPKILCPRFTDVFLVP